MCVCVYMCVYTHIYDHELTVAKFRLKLKKVEKTTRP